LAEVGPEQPKEVSCFPVTKEVADRTLAEIAENPARALMQESGIFQMENPELNKSLHSMVAVLPDSLKREYIEGALWTYRLLRTQVEQRGGKLPKISEQLCMSRFADNIELSESGESLSDSFKKQGKNLASMEPELGAALEKITRYRPDKSSLIGGATEVYFTIKKALKTKALEEQWGGK
jgi:hypothetical protein